MKNWTVDDVMTTAVISVDHTASYRTMVDLLIAHHLSAVPVIDAFQRVTGVVSEADLLRKIEYAGDEEPRLFERPRHRDERAKSAARTAVDLMSAPAVVVARGTSIAAAARLMDRKHVKRLPVVDDDGRLAGIVSRSDLLKVHLRADQDILTDIETEVFRPFLPDESAKVTVAVVDGVVTLAGQVDRWSDADLATRLIRQIPGVVELESTLSSAFDDRHLSAPSRLYGVPRSR